MTPRGGIVRAVRKLRCIVGEFLIETGLIIRDLGGFVLPNYEQHAAFQSNGDLDATASERPGVMDRETFYNGAGVRVRR